MKNKLVILSTTFLILAVLSGFGAVCLPTEEQSIVMLTRLSTLAGVFTLGSIGAFFIGMIA